MRIKNVLHCVATMLKCNANLENSTFYRSRVLLSPSFHIKVASWTWQIGELTAKLWSLPPYRVSWWCWESGAGNWGCFSFALSHSSCETFSVAQCGLGGSDLWIKSSPLLNHRQLSVKEQMQRVHPRVSTAAHTSCRHHENNCRHLYYVEMQFLASSRHWDKYVGHILQLFSALVH